METKKLSDILLIHDKMENILSKMQDNSVDAVISDPPFGVRKLEEWDDRMDFISSVDGWLRECLRVSKHTVIWFGAGKMLPYVLQGLIKREQHHYFARQHSWRKPEGSQLAGASNNNIWYSNEYIWVFSKDWDKTKSYGKDMPQGWDDFTYRTLAKKETGHPTAKAVPMMRKLIGHYSSLGETILDPFAGSFSTAIACIDMGRRCIAIEQSPLPDKPITDLDGDNPDYYNRGVDRVQRHLDAPRLFIGVEDEDTDSEDIDKTLNLFEEENETKI